MIGFTTSILRLAQQIIFPPFCAYCRSFLTEERIFCYSCDALIMPIVSVQIPLTEHKSMTVFAVSDYKEPLKSLIIAKHWSLPLASRQMAQIIWQKSNISNMPFDVLVPIPLHWTRYAWRGFNQSEIMATHIAQLSGRPVVHALKRARRTAFQSTLKSEERSENIAGAFMGSPNIGLIRNNHVLLVDDLMTTGSTLKAAAKTLLPYKPLSVSAMVVCRVI